MVQHGVIIQARMGSRRLPGKVLRTIKEKPLLQYLLDRLGRCESISRYVVATSTASSDVPIVKYCDQHGIECTRGPEQDVARRFLQCAEKLGLEYFVRLSADSPLLDTAIVSQLTKCFAQHSCDLVTNVMPRTFPRGQSVEVLRTSSLRSAYRRMTEPIDREHVTRFFYRHSNDFRIENIESELEYEGLHLAVDTEEDLATVEAILTTMDRPHWEYGLDDIVTLHESIVSRTS